MCLPRGVAAHRECLGNFIIVNKSLQCKVLNPRVLYLCDATSVASANTSLLRTYYATKSEG